MWYSCCDPHTRLSNSHRHSHANTNSVSDPDFVVGAAETDPEGGEPPLF